MKIAIIDDVDWISGSMRLVAEGAGHEVINICVGDLPPHPEFNEFPVSLYTRDLVEAAERVRAFCPDLFLIDHDLNLGLNSGKTGKEIAGLSGVSSDRCIGISSAFDQKDYCITAVEIDKRRIAEKWAADAFLKFISDFSSK